MDEANGKMRSKHEDVDAASLSADILNPFVHRLELDTTYDKLKTAFLTVALLPFRLAAITALVIMAWLLACLGLLGLSEEDLRRAPLTGWRRTYQLYATSLCLERRSEFTTKYD